MSSLVIATPAHPTLELPLHFTSSSLLRIPSQCLAKETLLLGNRLHVKMATPSEETCSLSKYRDLVQHYWDKGWAVAPRLFTREEVEQLTHEAQIVSKARLQTLQRDLQSQDQQVRKAAEAARDLTLDGVGEEAKPRKIEAPCLDSRCPSFRRCVADRRVIERIKAIVGKVGVQGKQASNADAQPHPLLLLEQCFMKPPGVGSAKPFHQDNFFFEVDPPDAVVTAWLALDDATVANGCIEYLSGSHKHGLVEHSANSAPKALPTVSERKSVDGAEWSSSNRVDNKAALKGSSIHPDLATALEGVCLEAVRVVARFFTCPCQIL